MNLGMQNRTELQSEYLQLINKLNMSNRKKNQQTELSFLIRTGSNKSKYLICTVNHENFLCLANMKSNNRWIVDADFEYQNLAEYILNNADLDQNNINLTIKSCLKRLFTVESANQ